MLVFNKKSKHEARSVKHEKDHASCIMPRVSKGVIVVAVLITIFLLAALGVGITYFAASNQQTRIQQVTGDQAFYSTQAGLEFALGKVLQEGSGSTGFTQTFSGETVTITRASDRITASAPEASARAEHAITDPSPPVVDCLIVDVSGAYIEAQNRLRGITIRRDVGCPDTVTVVSMSGTIWEPGGRQLNTIHIEGPPNEFNGPPDGSGGTFVFTNNFVINDYNIHGVDRIQWNANIVDHYFKLIFNYEYLGRNRSETAEIDF